MPNQDSSIKYHEQLPPQHNLAEEIILGGILVNAEITQLAIRELVAESFAIETHQLIYRTILDIYFKEKYVDSIILINTLWEINLLGKIGGIRKILNLLKQAQIFISQDITNLTAKYYIYLIKDKYLRRLLIQYGYNIIKLAYINSIESKHIFTKTDKYIDRIKYMITQEDKTSINSMLTKFLINLKCEQPLQVDIKRPSGFNTLDKIIDGFSHGDLIVIAGRPSMGKTSFSLNIALNMLKQDFKGICIFSLEMSKEQILYKLLSMASKIPVNKLKAGYINKNDWIQIQNASHQLVSSIINIDDTANLSITNLSIKAKTFKNEYPSMSIMIIDYLQLVQVNNPKSSNRSEELSIITRSLKILAKELNIPVIIISQLNRNAESRINKQPLLSDLRESGCLNKSTQIAQYSLKTSSNSYFEYKPLMITFDYCHQYIKYNIEQTITRSTTQYEYKIIKGSCNLVNTTHNHLVFTHQGWQKVDTIKSHQYTITYSINREQSIKRISLTNTKQLMYDVTMPETRSIYCNNNFHVHNSIEQDADLVLMLYRESYYIQHTNKQDITNLIVAKHRNGPTGTIELQFNATLASFTDII
uniref:Replicative DNA helicase n=1 Tax=Liagoropsis maxima TaxID=1653392 RepID=A0A1G4NW26_9FLOR|nr:Replication helicase subunit [Liagoropsis maxima]SCW22860.1 Replication helicase subunit [Liagoropsis maxima]